MLKLFMTTTFQFLFVVSADFRWQLAMNLNPSDGNIMDYCNINWYTDVQYGNRETALLSDFVNKAIRNIKMSYIAIVRHTHGTPDAIKTWKLKTETESLLQWFQKMNPGSIIATTGGHIQKQISPSANDMSDDPIFSLDGDLALNWEYGNNGCRIALSDGHLSKPDANDDNTHGIGTGYMLENSGLECFNFVDTCYAEITAIQDCPSSSCHEGTKAVGNDSFAAHSTCAYEPVSGYGSYAVYVSSSSKLFPDLEKITRLEINMIISGISLRLI